MKQLKILRPFNYSSYQYFMQWFVDACEGAGIEGVDNIQMPWKIRLFVARSRISSQLSFVCRHNHVLIVPCGGYPDSFCFPFGYTHEIVPVLWDTWPRYHDRIVSSFRRHCVKVAFFTQRMVAEKIHALLPNVACHWLPEGINEAVYIKGERLSARSHNVLELGRLNQDYHSAIMGGGGRGVMFRDQREGLLFNDFDSLKQGLSDTKIVVNFPRCDTNPEMAGGIETLTQRYWESMLSRSLMIGRAPKELVDFIGYNPVIDVDWRNPMKQLKSLLANIDSYQDFVDKNYRVALQMSPWRERVPKLLESIIRVYTDIAPTQLQSR